MIDRTLRAHLKEIELMTKNLEIESDYKVISSYREWYKVASEQIIESLLEVVEREKFLKIYQEYWSKIDPDNEYDIRSLLNYADLALRHTLTEVRKMRQSDNLKIEKSNAFDSALCLWLKDLDEMLNESNISPAHKAAGYIDWYDRVNKQLLELGISENDTTQCNYGWENATPSCFPEDYVSNSSINSLIRFAKSALLKIREGNKDVIPVVGELFPLEIVDKSKDWVKNVARQVNGCYEKGWYDASAVMLRRLLEQLIIDCFYVYGALDQVKNDENEIFSLKDLVQKFLEESRKPNGLWHIERSAISIIPKLKDVGNRAAHGRYLKTRRHNLDRYQEDLEIVIQELVGIIEQGM
jgi:hypothetical protein